ncbi:MAG: permease-like cell division protein FtsX [Kangiella sp.]|nr:permease-like cell division protein FtsX [Kangiella sp.]
MSKSNRQNTSYKISFLDRFKMAISLHKKNAANTLLDVLRHPTNSLLTILVLAIALALPTAFYVFSSNAKAISSNWSGGVQMALFLKENVSQEQRAEFIQELSFRPEFKEVVLIPKEQAIEDFKQQSGFGDALDYLDENPLPDSIILTPYENHSGAAMLEKLAQELEQNPVVDLAQLDMAWIQRYQAILEISQKVGTFVSILLAFGVLLIVGNTIRLAILNRRDEIQVIKLVGATDAFIRRPFLYTGFWYGLIAALLAALMVNIVLLLLQQPSSTLAELYNSGFSLMGLAPSQTLTLLAIGASLGLFGAWFSVSKHLKDIQPT